MIARGQPAVVGMHGATVRLLRSKDGQKGRSSITLYFACGPLSLKLLMNGWMIGRMVRFTSERDSGAWKRENIECSPYNQETSDSAKVRQPPIHARG